VCKTSNTATPIPPAGYFPLTASLGEEVRARCLLTPPPGEAAGGGARRAEGAAHLVASTATPIPPAGYFPLTASLGEEVSARCLLTPPPGEAAGGGARRAEGAAHLVASTANPHPPCGVLPPKLRWGKRPTKKTAQRGLRGLVLGT
jgi:hypothetical protein